ncbi:MAG: hypothetical protein MR819_06445 [Prevotella sp.]|nr:hypothetical protein [Prevotella sp.]
MNKKILRTEGCKPTTPTSIFRRWCVTAIILCFTMSANAQTEETNNGGAFHGLNDLIGKTLDELIQNATDATTFSMKDPSKVFFLYNLETKQFLNSGSYWGTHVSLKYYGLPLWVVKVNTDNNRINFAQNLKTGQGQYIAWFKHSNGEDSPNTGCFIDRTKDEATGWYFEATNDGKNSYKIYTRPKADSNTKYYLHGNPEPYADKRCEADKDENNQLVKGYGTWRVFSLQQLYDIQEQNMENMTESLELSFKLRCPSFSRGDADIKHWNTTIWNTGNANAKQRFGLEHLYYTSNQITDNNGNKKNYDVNAFSGIGTTKIPSYTFPEGKDEAKTITITSDEQYQLYLGKYFCADAKNTRGRIFQKVEVKNEGTYVIECKAFSNTEKAKLFAVVLDKNENEIENTLHTTVLWQIENMSQTQQEQLHINEQNMDYAGRNFYSSFQYTNSVLVHVKKKPEDVRYIAFGIQIGDNEEDTPIADAAKEWTVFDDFRLLFAAKGVDTDLVLDEDAPDLNYLKECDYTYKNAILHLNKTIQTDVWTSIILPVNLTKNQFTTAFGANARLAKLEKVVGTEIRFKTINLQNMADDGVALVAYTPYILYSTEVKRTSPKYEARLNVSTSGSSDTRLVRIKANHIGIPNVTFATKNNANDLSKMDENWLTKASYNDETSPLTIYGTFARTFAPKSTQNETTYVWNFNDNNYNKDDKKTIITGRPDLKGCYFFDQGKMWYSASRPRGLRGFSCWIAPKNQGSATPANAKLFLDGIDMTGTTDIEDIFGGEEGKKVEKFANGIYNINGQLVRANSDSTEGLPEGLYIINGKKSLVKH